MKMSKRYETQKEWVKYLTVENYFTDNEIEYRRRDVEADGFEFEKIKKEIQEFRRRYAKQISLFEDEKFIFVSTTELQRRIETIKSFWKSAWYTIKDTYRKELILDTLISEAFHSSSIEGAYSTKKRTEEIIKKNLSPADKSELMIVNNYHGLQYSSEHRRQSLSDAFVLEIHSIISNGTLDNIEDEGVYRNGPVDIRTQTQKIIFSPTSNIPKMNSMLQALFQFVNEDDDLSEAIDPVYKALFFHFAYGYIHPHFDGNGRTVRVLFTHLLDAYGHDMFSLISLSEIIAEHKKGYEKAFVDVERNNLDVTYFFYFMTDIMIKGLNTLKDRIMLYMREHIILDKAKVKKTPLTKRQEHVLKIIARNKTTLAMTRMEIAKRIKFSPATIAKDLNYLEEWGLLIKRKTKRTFYYLLDLDKS